MYIPIDDLISGASVVAAAIDTIGLPWRSVRAVREERRCRVPGDELIQNPIGTLNHAVTIQGPRAAVWPWLAQMGAGSRAGWYSYDFVDNGRQPSAEQIVPEWQRLAIGMTFPAAPGMQDGFTLMAFKPEHFLTLGWLAPDGSPLVTWTFVLEDFGRDSTRLLVRARAGQGYRVHHLPLWLTKRLMTIVHFIMERRQLLGIARRAERWQQSGSVETSNVPVICRHAA